MSERSVLWYLRFGGVDPVGVLVTETPGCNGPERQVSELPQ